MSACIPALSSARSLPLWELGAGAMALSVPDYRGSAVTHTYVSPAPYFAYRGEHLKADRGGVRGMFLETDTVKLDLSVGLGLGGRSRENAARAGMPDLKPTLEIGPTANFTVWRSRKQDMEVDLRLPLRASVTVESSPRSIGWVFSPNLRLTMRRPGGFADSALRLHTGPVFNDRRYNDHFYSVDSRYATPERPVYAASAGYAGMQLSAALTTQAGPMFVGTYLRYDALRGTSFEDSPLVRRDSALTVGVIAVWVFGKSSTRVDVED